MRDGWALVEETFALGDRKKTQILKTGFHLLLFVLLRLFNTHHLRGGAPHTHTYTSVRHPLFGLTIITPGFLIYLIINQRRFNGN